MIKPILQSENAECGLACLVMISNHFGHDLDLIYLRSRFKVSGAGMSLSSLIAAAKVVSLDCRPLRIELEDLEHLELPAVLHWDMNHFVVLKSLQGDKLSIVDPKIGSIKISRQRASDHFTGVAIEFDQMPDFQRLQAQGAIGFLSLISGAAGLMQAGFLFLTLTVMYQGLTLVSPFFLQVITDQISVNSDRNTTFIVFFGFVVALFIQAVSRSVREWLITDVGYTITQRMFSSTMNHLFQLPASYFEARATGDITSRVQSLQPIQRILTTGIVLSIVDGFLAVVLCIVIFSYSWVCGLIIVALTLIDTVVRLAYFPGLRARQHEQILAMAAENSSVIESIRNVRPIKLFAMEDRVSNRWKNVFVNVINRGMSVSRYHIGMTFFSENVSHLQTVLVLFVATLAVQSEGMSIGMLVALFSYQLSFSSSVRSFLTYLVEFKMLDIHLDRVGDILQEEKEDSTQVTIPDALKERSPSFMVSDLSFRYGIGEKRIFDHVNLKITAGEMIALVGPSGGGKTTLVKLLTGLLEPETGSIEVKLGETPLSSLIQLRSICGVVQQDDKLFAASILENITFFDPLPEIDRVQQICEEIGLSSEIMHMPMAYETLLGEHGATISGGQRQRVLIARALYSQPKLLILDEGTANLDPGNEERIAQAIESMNCTRVIIAHRPSLVKKSDRIVQVCDQKVTELSRAEYNARMSNLTPASAQKARSGISVIS